MFDIGFPELVLVAIVGLLVIGPERLPEALRTLGLWLGRMRRSFTAVKSEIEKEIGMDEVRRQLHNEAIMEEMKRIENEVRSTASDVRSTINDAGSTRPGETAALSAPEATGTEAAGTDEPAPASGTTTPTVPAAAAEPRAGEPEPPADGEGPARANNG